MHGQAPALERLINVHVIDCIKGDAYEAVVCLEGKGEPSIRDVKQLDATVQPALTIEELCLAEECIRKDERVLKAAADVGVKPEQLYADGWSIGWDNRFPGKRVQQCLTFARFSEHENLYAHPMEFMPILDNNTGEVLAIDYPPHRTNGKLPGSTAPPKEANFDLPDRKRIPPPLKAHDYLPELAQASPFTDEPITMRTDLKPLSVVQPEGVSFKRTGSVLEWQKWKVRWQ